MSQVSFLKNYSRSLNALLHFHVPIRNPKQNIEFALNRSPSAQMLSSAVFSTVTDFDFELKIKKKWVLKIETDIYLLQSVNHSKTCVKRPLQKDRKLVSRPIVA